MSDNEVNRSRRRFLTATTSVVGAVGAGLAAVPFLQSWEPSAKARVVGAPVEANVGPLQPGQLMKLQWRGQTIGVLRRTPAMIDRLDKVRPYLLDPESEQSDQQPAYARNQYRSIKPDYLILNMHCTHLGCVPELVPEVGPQPFEEDWYGGFFCPCHKSKFDLAGRVYKGVPAPLNLVVPPYHFIDDQTIIVGQNPEGAA